MKFESAGILTSAMPVRILLSTPDPIPSKNT